MVEKSSGHRQAYLNLIAVLDKSFDKEIEWTKQNFSVIFLGLDDTLLVQAQIVSVSFLSSAIWRHRGKIWSVKLFVVTI